MSCLLPKAISFNSDRERSLQAISTLQFSLSQEPWKPTEEQNPPPPQLPSNPLLSVPQSLETSE